MAILKKKFFKVEIPLLNIEIEVITTSIEKLNNRIVKLDLTRNLRGKNLEATLIIKVENGKAIAEVKSLRLMPQYMARLMRNNVSYVEDSFLCKTKDMSIRIKTFMLTRKKVHRSVRKAIRNKAKEIIIQSCATKSADEICEDVIFGKLQKTLSVSLKKIYPLALCEVKAVIKQQ